jgi:hypothetical protein
VCESSLAGRRVDGSMRARRFGRAALLTREGKEGRARGGVGGGARVRGRAPRESHGARNCPPPPAGRALLQGCSARGDTSHRSARRGRAAKRPVAVARARGGGGRSCCRPRRRQSRAAGACGAVVDRDLAAASHGRAQPPPPLAPPPPRSSPSLPFSCSSLLHWRRPRLAGEGGRGRAPPTKVGARRKAG